MWEIVSNFVAFLENPNFTKRELSFTYYDTLITMGQSLFLTEEELKLEINDKE